MLVRNQITSNRSIHKVKYQNIDFNVIKATICKIQMLKSLQIYSKIEMNVWFVLLEAVLVLKKQSSFINYENDTNLFFYFNTSNDYNLSVIRK